MADDDEPDPYAAANMADLDSWSKSWRELAHEYGFVIVAALRDSGMSFDDADFTCECKRDEKQREWLATDYHPGGRITEKMEAENELRRRAAGIEKR